MSIQKFCTYSSVSSALKSPKTRNSHTLNYNDLKLSLNFLEELLRLCWWSINTENGPFLLSKVDFKANTFYTILKFKGCQ